MSENVSIDKARIQKTPNQVITELWFRDRKLTIYLDNRHDEQGETQTSVEIYQVSEQSQDIGESKDIVASLLWLAGDYVEQQESKQ